MNIIPNKYNMIVAADEDWCIGKDGNLLDHLSEDMKCFKSITKNKEYEKDYSRKIIDCNIN